MNFLQRKKGFQVTEDGNPEPSQPGTWSMYLDGKWYGLTAGEVTLAPPEGLVDSLDVSVFRIACWIQSWESRTCARINELISSAACAGPKNWSDLLNEGKAAVAFSLHATTVEDLFRVSDAGEIMPPKSTWFEPKLRDGLLIHRLDC